VKARALHLRIRMHAPTPPIEVLIDFLVPAKLASRYRARLAEVSFHEVRLELPFRPAPFRLGILVSCPARLTLVVRAHVVQLVGTFEPEVDTTRASFRFEQPISPRDLELLRWAAGPVPSAGAPSRELDVLRDHPAPGLEAAV
jgi:hypothetical protein